MDHQLVDKDGRRCGKVDDLALEGNPGEPLEVTAILAGPSVWPQRAGWIGRYAEAVAAGGRVRVPWSEVKGLDAGGVLLRKSASELGLGRGDDRMKRWVERIPRA